MVFTGPTAPFTKSAASLYRKELAKRKTSRYVGKGLPREERDLTEQEMDHRRQKLAEYDGQKKRVTTGKWAQNTKDLKTGQQKLQESVDQLGEDQNAWVQDIVKRVVEGVKTATVPLTTDEGDWVKILNSKPVPLLNQLMKAASLNLKGKRKIDKAMELAKGVAPVELRDLLDKSQPSSTPTAAATLDSFLSRKPAADDKKRKKDKKEKQEKEDRKDKNDNMDDLPDKDVIERKFKRLAGTWS